jgi:hypothetical protein
MNESFFEALAGEQAAQQQRGFCAALAPVDMRIGAVEMMTSAQATMRSEILACRSTVATTGQPGATCGPREPYNAPSGSVFVVETMAPWLLTQIASSGPLTLKGSACVRVSSINA